VWAPQSKILVTQGKVIGPVWPNGPRYMLKYQGVSQKRKGLSVKYKINSVFSQRVSPKMQTTVAWFCTFHFR
jgi:hypothetical protein